MSKFPKSVGCLFCEYYNLNCSWNSVYCRCLNATVGPVRGGRYVHINHVLTWVPEPEHVDKKLVLTAATWLDGKNMRPLKK